MKTFDHFAAAALTGLLASNDDRLTKDSAVAEAARLGHRLAAQLCMVHDHEPLEAEFGEPPRCGRCGEKVYGSGRLRSDPPPPRHEPSPIPPGHKGSPYR